MTATPGSSLPASGSFSSVPSPHPTIVTGLSTSARDHFARSIKKDSESYPAFKKARFWDAWNRELISKAHLHEISDLFNPNFVPATNAESQLFELQKKFLYAVFLSKVTVADGINIVKTEKDAQKCYQALVFRFEQSAEATMDAQSIREKIQDLKLDKSWRSSATKFINHYESQVILLESLTVDRALLWHEKTKITMLASAVKSNKDLASIMSQDLLDVAKGRAAMTYEQYIALLKCKAHELDGGEKSTGGGRSSRYQTINKSERDGRGGRGGRGGREGRGFGRGGRGRGNDKDKKKTGLFVKEELYTQLPPEVKNLIWQAREGAEKDGNNTTPASRDVHQAETTTVQAAATVPTAALGIMQAVTKTTSSAPDIRNVLAAVRGSSSSSNRGEYCIAEDGKVYLTMNTLRQYRFTAVSV